MEVSAYDLFSSSKESRSSNDVALVMLNESDGKVVEMGADFALRNMLSSHYSAGNILTFTSEEIQKCTRLIQSQKSEFRCKKFSSVPCEINSIHWTSALKDVEKKVESEVCPKLDQIKRVLEEADSIDAYSATHSMGGLPLAAFADSLHYRPDIQKKFRLFYSMGCYDAKKDDSIMPAFALKAGFASFVGHRGLSVSPIAFNSFKTRLGMGETVGQAVEKFNKGLKGSVLSKGTEMHVIGDPSTSIWKRPKMNGKSKYCVMNRGKVPLSELNEKGGDCVTEDIITEYYLKYPTLIDDKFCDSVEVSFDQARELAFMGIGACASVGRQMPKVDKLTTWFFDKGEVLRKLNHNLTCVEGEADLARGIYCFYRWGGESLDEFKSVLTKRPEFKNRVKTILKLMEQFTPADCQTKK